MNMECWLLIILANMILVCFLFYTKIYLLLQYKRDELNDYIRIEVYVMGRLVLYRIQVPMIKIIGEKGSLWVESEIKTGQNQDKTQTRKEQRVVKENIRFYMTHPRKLKAIAHQIRYYGRLYCKVLDKIIKSLHCEKLYWKTSYGSDDAGVTGSLFGILWMLKTLLITNLEKKVSFEDKPVIHVHPIFGQTHFKVDFQCIFSIRLGNVITAMRSIYSVKR